MRRNTCRGCSALCSRLEEMWDKCIASVCSWSRMEDQWVLRELRVGEGEGRREGGLRMQKAERRKEEERRMKEG